MQLSVFHIYTQGKNNEINIHVLIPKSKGINFAIECGKKFLSEANEEKARLTLRECRLCYITEASKMQQKEVEKQGYTITENGDC